jgi:molybdopterin molybdotransferase
LLSYEQALERILAAAVGNGETEEVELTDSRGRALARDFFAPISLPPFDNTAIDGFAVRSEDTFPHRPSVRDKQREYSRAVCCPRARMLS